MFVFFDFIGHESIRVLKIKLVHLRGNRTDLVVPGFAVVCSGMLMQVMRLIRLGCDQLLIPPTTRSCPLPVVVYLKALSVCSAKVPRGVTTAVMRRLFVTLIVVSLCVFCRFRIFFIVT